MAADLPLRPCKRTRILLHLPQNDDSQVIAVAEVVDYLQNSRELGVDGFTHSVVRPTAFAGYWWNTANPSAPTLVFDAIVVCIIDVAELLVPLEVFIRDLKLYVDGVYRIITNEPEAEIWVVSHGIEQWPRGAASCKAQA